MKKILLFLTVFCAVNLSAQTFSDDFETYKAGDFVAKTNPKWTTWANKPGTTEDTKVSAEKAHAGTLSAKFASTVAGGGPTDLVLPFFDVVTKKITYDVGVFESTMWIYVPKGKTAYFNYQANAPVGSVWVLDAYFDADGTFRLNSIAAGGEQGKTSYKQDTWVKYSCNIDMTSNTWVISLDDVKVAKFSTPVNKLFAMNIYPADVNALFYIDDVSTNFTPFVPKQLDAAMTSITMKNKALKGKDYVVGGTFRNLGKDTIKTLDYTWTDGSSTYSAKLAALNILPLAAFNFTPKETYIADVVANKLNFTITKVNGKTDDDVLNNKKDLTVNVVVPAPGKKVVAEETTGTWCQWCPRGHVFMNLMAKEYPEYFVGIAVHGGSASEPMLLEDYATQVQSTGYPNVLVDREKDIDPSLLEDNFFARIAETPHAKLENKVFFDAKTKEMKVEVKVTFNANVKAGNYKLVAVVMEDSVKGTTSAYNQANAYANNAAGVMGGYEKLPNPVPAAKMVYNHTARALLTLPEGDDLKTDPKSGEVITKTFTYTVPSTSKDKYMEVASIILDNNDIAINGEYTKYDKFQALSATNDLTDHEYFKGISPNPTNNITYIELNIKDLATVKINVTDINGRVVASRDYGQVQGSNFFPVDCTSFAAGIYLARIQIGNEIVTKKLVKN
jgi:hypothetical protein